MTTPLHPPMGQRLPAEQVINPQLVAALARASVDAADALVGAWFATVSERCKSGLILVFDRFVVGEPCPLLLEAAHQTRMARRSNAINSVDPDEGDDVDDDEPPAIPHQVLAAMARGQEADRVVSGQAVTARLVGRSSSDPESILDDIGVMIALEGVVVSLADTIKIGTAAVIDARLAYERRHRWAA